MGPNPTLLDLAPGALCHRCGYDLRGLGERQSCPECNEPVWFSAAKRVGELHRHRRWAGHAKGWLVAQVCMAAWLTVPTAACVWGVVTGQSPIHPGDGLVAMAAVSRFLVYCPPVAPVAAGFALVLAIRAWGTRGLLREHPVFSALWALSAVIILACMGSGVPLLGLVID